MATAPLSRFNYFFIGFTALSLGFLSVQQVHPSSQALLTSACPLHNNIIFILTFNINIRVRSLLRSSIDILILVSTSYYYKLCAVLRDISEGTSYQIVRLVFRPYTKLMPTNCTSVRLKTSIRVSPDFIQSWHSSLSIGSHCSNYSTFVAPRILKIVSSLDQCSPWSVFQDGCNKLPSVHVISLLSRQKACFFPSQYLFAIGVLLYLVFDEIYHRFTMHYQAWLLY